jgi:diadenylate cyclase
LAVSSGGFLLDAEFSPQRLSELAKMDGAIILADDASRIARANVHLVPDSGIATSETGTRHRTAERVARQIAVPVVTVSEDMAVVAVHLGTAKYTLEPIPRVLARANQALTILERYKARLDTVTHSLSGLEVEGLVTVRDVAAVLQRCEMVRRIADEVEQYVIELGEDGRLVTMQLDELIAGVFEEQELVIRDYCAANDVSDEILERLRELDEVQLLDAHAVAHALMSQRDVDLELALESRGYRLLRMVPRLPGNIADRVVEHLGTLQQVLRASKSDLEEVEGVGSQRAQLIKEGLSRLAENSILERYI